MSQLLLKVIAIGLLFAAGFCYPQTMIPPDPYTQFLRYVSSNSRHWNPSITRKEIEDYSWSTWEGCGENPKLAYTYFHVSCEESNMRLLDNKAGFGWSGATWGVIYKAIKNEKRSTVGFMDWAEKHPYETNRLTAKYFSGLISGRSVWHWHNNPNNQNNKDYVDNVNKIALYCSRNTGLLAWKN